MIPQSVWFTLAGVSGVGLLYVFWLIWKGRKVALTPVEDTHRRDALIARRETHLTPLIETLRSYRKRLEKMITEAPLLPISEQEKYLEEEARLITKGVQGHNSYYLHIKFSDSELDNIWEELDEIRTNISDAQLSDDVTAYLKLVDDAGDMQLWFRMRESWGNTTADKSKQEHRELMELLRQRESKIAKRIEELMRGDDAL